jgi:BirA family biotin operon repressor/biotin-[acetyl-CoA-carboxylase] ligase
MEAESEQQGSHGTRFFSVEHVIETGSTNADLVERARNGAPEGIALVADHQTAGRGRQNRTWHDEPGDAMLLSVLLRPPAPLVPLIPLLSGLAITDGVERILGGARGRAGLKWPNDVIVPELGERKLAGTLAEVVTGPGLDDGPAVVAGTGLNLRWSTPPPPDIEARAAVLEDLAGHHLDRWEVVHQVLVSYETWLRRSDDGPEVILDEYRRRCVTLGREVRFQTPTETIHGTAVAVAASGGLVIDRHGEQVTVTAGEAHHL